MTAFSSTFQDIQNEVIDKLRLDASADLARVKGYINQVLADVAARTRYFSGSAAGAALTAAATSQALPATLIELEYVTCAFGGQTIVMQAKPFSEILMLRAPTSGSGPPVFYCLRKGTIEFWPAAQGGEILTYYGATMPDALSANSDVSGLPEPHNSVLLSLGACIEAADFKNDPKLYFYYQQAYQQAMGEFFAYLNMRVTQEGRAFPIYGPDGRPFGVPFVPHDPSSDWFVTGWRS